MTVRYLNCAPMSPWFPRWHVGAACLLVDTDCGPVLVDTGLGLHDHARPRAMVRIIGRLLGAKRDSPTAAVRQVDRLGLSPADVHHIVLTHLHFDHAGGVPDFPHAKIHVHRREYDAMRHPRTWIELGYDPADFAHGPEWVLYDRVDAKWLGLPAIGLPFKPSMFLVPLFGHTRGLCGVAIEDGGRWLLQCGDALPVGAQFDIAPEWLSRVVLGPHMTALRAWSLEHPQVQLLAGHMWQSFFSPGGQAT